MKYFRKIQGERLYLSPMNKDDVEIFTKWLNDKETTKYLPHYHQVITLAAEQEWLDKPVSNGQHYAMVTNDDVLIGSIGLMEINHMNRTATLGLFIGDKEQRGKGYGTEAIRLLIEYGFNTLNLQNIMLTVQTDNEQGIACYKKVGFKEFGRRSKCNFRDGKYIDLIYMEILS